MSQREANEELAAWVQVLILALVFVLLCALQGCATGEALVNEAVALPPEFWTMLLALVTYLLVGKPI